MPKPGPLTQEQARNSLAHKLSGVADNLRQLSTRFGLRPQRVFLVWTEWSGEHRGEGTESLLAEVELLPTPRVSDATALARRGYSAGAIPEGTLRVDQISAGRYTADMLWGLRIPDDGAGRVLSESEAEPSSKSNVDFWYEMQEDGRGDNPARRERFRLFSSPHREAGSLYWSVNLESASEPRNRAGDSTQIGLNEADSPFGHLTGGL